jgi:histidinol-phosphate aminotransferase
MRKMKEIKTLVRSNILNLKPYSSARDEYKGDYGIFLDANENPFGSLNRYPDPHQKKLKQKLSKVYDISAENIFVGNGSDEVIDLVFRVFCNPEKDRVVVCPPTYGMYEVSANINNVEVVPIPLDENFQPKVDEIINTEAKIVFLCSPNNPTGNTLENIEEIIENFNGIVFVDEAYIDFSSRPSLREKVLEFPNLIVSQTLSKAWGKAAIRVGLGYMSKEIISYFNKVKPPYNVSQLNQNEAIKTLEQFDVFNNNKLTILKQREWLLKQLAKLDIVEKIYPTDANFILAKTKNANLIYQKLIDEKIVVRNRHSVIENSIRITVGEESENQKLIESLRMIEL